MKKHRFWIIIYLILYGFFSFSFLEIFPLVHSDESWLAGLTRTMMEQMDFSVTESFFDAWIRCPHAVKILFHALQMLFLSFADHSIGSVRLISLLAGLAVLYLFYLTVEKLLNSRSMAFIFLLLFGFDLQFIYASHFARQEILLLLLLTASLYVFFCTGQPYTVKNALLLGIFTGIGIGLHPNSFLLACMTGCMMLAYLIHNKCRNLKPLAVYIGLSGLFACIIIAISNSFRPNFLSNYFAYGSDTFGIDASADDRLASLIGFFSRLFSREGGTYYVADIRLQLTLFGIVVLFLFFFYLVMRREAIVFCQNTLMLIFGMFGIIAGIFIIGRFSQLSIVFLFPASYLLTAMFFTLFEKKLKTGLSILLCTVLLMISAKEIIPFFSYSTYGHYLEQISDYVMPSDHVLGNLNMDFYFDDHALTDYRNLPFVMEEYGTLEAYIEAHQFAYIFYTSELTYYYEHRPFYNTIYGNIMFAGELLRYCEEECEYIGSFNNAYYAPRILELIGNEAYGEVFIYRTRYAE